MRSRLSSLWMVINRPPCEADFDSASIRFEAGICFRHGCLHPELLTPDF